MEQDVIRVPFSTTGGCGEYTEESGRRKDLGIPTVSDRVAQMVVRDKLEIMVEPHFLEDSLWVSIGSISP